jgi:hypothetical protein
MKKLLAIITILVAGVVGYLYYDWDTKTKRAASEPKKILFAWTDENGIKHFTDKVPPKGAKNVEKTVGYKYVKPPLVNTLKNSVVNLYYRTKNKLSDFFKKASEKDKK